MAITVLDSPVIHLLSAISVSDAVTLGDNITIRIQGQLQIADAVTVTDVDPVVNLRSFASVTDAITVGESATIQLTAGLLNPTDAVTIGDSVVMEEIDLINVTDLVTVQSRAASFTDTITVGDDATIELINFASVADAVTIGETAAAGILVYVPTTVTDAITVGESVVMAAGGYKFNVTDGITVGEFETAVLPANFSYYKALTIQTGEVPSAQSNMAVLIPFIAGDANLAHTSFGGHVQNINGYDIRPFSDQTLTTPLTYELVTGTYDPATGIFQMWVLMTSVLDGGKIYLGYGNGNLATDGSSRSTWDANYSGVFHLDNPLGATTVTIDSAGSTPMRVIPETSIAGGVLVSVADSSNAGVFTPVNQGVQPSGTVGKTGTVASLTALLKQYVSLAATGTHSGTITAEAWIYLNATGTMECIVSKGLAAGNTEWALYYDGAHAAFAANNGTVVGIVGGTALAAATWYHAVGTYDGTNWRLYVNGASDGTPVSTVGPISTTAEHEIGALSTSGTPAQFWDGLLGEVRVSNLARSSSWIQTEYNNQSNLTAFWLTGPEVPVGVVQVTDAVTVADVPVIHLRSAAVASELVTTGEVVALSMQSFPNVTELLTVTDTPSILVRSNNVFVFNVIDLVTMNDATTEIVTPLQVVASDAVTVGEPITVQPQIQVVAVELVTMGDQIFAVSTTWLINVSDRAIVREDVTIAIIEPPVIPVCIPFRKPVVTTRNDRRELVGVGVSRSKIRPHDCEND